jgi:hypothetical protein
MSKFYKISEEELIRLLARSMELACLEGDGVDNWSYYGEGFEHDIQLWAMKVGLPLFEIIVPEDRHKQGIVNNFEYDYEDIAIARLKEFDLIY